MHIEPFKISVSDAGIDDLRRRLRNSRWASATPSEPWQQGMDTSWLRELVTYWADDFDWKAAERGLNQQPQFMADVNGQRVHFVHQRGVGPRPYPLVITHGWPGSFFEFHELAERLRDPAAFGADPNDAFDVVIPSLPGFAFSPAPATPGTSAFQLADLWASLLRGLGYERFGAQGGDLGAGVSVALALRHSQVVDGIHLNFLPGSYEPAIDAADSPLTVAEQNFLREKVEWAALEGGYAHMHSTKPQTLAASLNDSPAGLAAWIGEKFRAWSDCDGVIERSGMTPAVRHRTGSCQLRPFRGNGSRTLKRPFGLRSLPLTRKNDAAGTSRTRPHAWNSRRLSASFSRPGAPRVSLYPNLVIACRAALHMIDERAQLRHDLPVAWIAEKHPRSHRRVCLQHLYQFSLSQPNSCQWLRQLGKAQAFHRRAKRGGKVTGDEGAGYGDLDRLVVVDE
jgi:pimeloyl-ACP methyl ester carboxylesterase